MNTNFGKELILRNIKAHGQTFVFKRQGKNTFGEPNGTETVVASIEGLFHQSRSYITKNTSDGTISRTKPQPQILCLVSDSTKLIKQGDILFLSDNKYTVTGVDNLGELDMACDISLEVFDNGV